ncbi:hypothetical protein V8E53_011703 [Lactarius tabidus]
MGSMGKGVGEMGKGGMGKGVREMGKGGMGKGVGEMGKGGMGKGGRWGRGAWRGGTWRWGRGAWGGGGMEMGNRGMGKGGMGKGRCGMGAWGRGAWGRGAWGRGAQEVGGRDGEGEHGEVGGGDGEGGMEKGVGEMGTAVGEMGTVVGEMGKGSMGKGVREMGKGAWGREWGRWGWGAWGRQWGEIGKGVRQVRKGVGKMEKGSIGKAVEEMGRGAWGHPFSLLYHHHLLVFPARFMTVLELYRAQRDTQSQVQAAPPSPTFWVQYQPDAPPVYHTLLAILSSQATVVAQEELDAIREAVPSLPNTPSPETILEAVECVLPSLLNEVTAMSIHAMEQVLAQSSAPNNLELNDVPPEVWAAPRSAVPVRGSSLNDSISRSSSFAEARESIQSGASSPMDNLPTNIVNTPLFLAGSSSEGQLSTSYHPQSIEAVDNLLHVIGDHNHPISVYSSTDSAAGHQAAITSHLQHAPVSLDVQGALNTMRDELNQAVEGHSHYFLRELLTIMEDPVFPVQSNELCHILDLAAAALSPGPRLESDDDFWCLLRPSDWHTNTLPALNTQHDLLEAMALQIAEHLNIDNGPYLPQDSIDSIRAMVWRAHEAQIRAAVANKANKVEHQLTTMGLSELIDGLLNEAPMNKITSTIKEDIKLQICSKYNNK